MKCIVEFAALLPAGYIYVYRRSQSYLHHALLGSLDRAYRFNQRGVSFLPTTQIENLRVRSLVPRRLHRYVNLLLVRVRARMRSFFSVNTHARMCHNDALRAITPRTVRCEEWLIIHSLRERKEYVIIKVNIPLPGWQMPRY